MSEAWKIATVVVVCVFGIWVVQFVIRDYLKQARSSREYQQRLSEEAHRRARAQATSNADPASSNAATDPALLNLGILAGATAASASPSSATEGSASSDTGATHSSSSDSSSSSW